MPTAHYSVLLVAWHFRYRAADALVIHHIERYGIRRSNCGQCESVRNKEWSSILIPVRRPDSGSTLFGMTVSTNQDQDPLVAVSSIDPSGSTVETTCDNDSTSGVDSVVEAVNERLVKREIRF